MSANRKRRRRPDSNTDGAAHRPAGPPGDLYRPWLLAATVAIFVARPLVPVESKSLVESGDGLPFVMLNCLLAFLWALRAALAGRLALRWGWTDWAVLGLLIWHSLTGLWAMQHGAPRPALNVLWEWVGMGLGFFLLRQLLNPGRETRCLLALMAALAVGHSGLGLYQHFISLPETRRVYEENPEAALRTAGMPIFEEGSVERRRFKDRLFASGNAPFSTFAHPNSLAGYLAPWLIVTLVIAVALGRERDRRSWHFWASLACLAGQAACLYFTRSRAAVAATVIGVAGIGLLHTPVGGAARRWKWVLAAAGLLLAAVLVATLSGAGDDLVSGAQKSLEYRLSYWQASAAMIADHFWLGVGPGNFQAHYTGYMLPQSLEEIQDPHSFLVEVWATAGAPAVLLLLAVLALFNCETRPRALDPGPETSGGAPAAVPAWDATGHILIGALAGFAVAWLCGLLTTTGPITDGMLLILPVSCLAMFACRHWIKQGRMPPGLPCLAGAVLLINLLAASGIGFAGVAGSLWLLIAMGLNAAGPSLPVAVGRPIAAYAVLILLGAVGLGCYLTGFRPVLNCQTEMRAAQIDPYSAREHLAAAAAADPWSADPWWALAGLQLGRWKEDKSAASFAEFERLLDEALRRNPDSSTAWLQAGALCEQAFEESEDPAHARLAVAKYQRAKELYPTSPLYWARYALALHAAEDPAAAAAKATALALKPHPDKALTAELKRDLERIP